MPLIMRLGIIMLLDQLLPQLRSCLHLLLHLNALAREFVRCFLRISVYELVLIWSFQCCVMKMSRQWMYDDRCSPQFVNGVQTFLLAAEENKRADGFMPCPCVGCKNGHNYSNLRTIRVHLFESGFMPHYNVWTKHGERGVMME